MAKGVGRPFNIEKRKINKDGDMIGTSKRKGVNFKGL